MEKEENSDRQNSGDESPDVFINPRTYFGFKKIFNNPQMIMSFLNAVISQRMQKKFSDNIAHLSAC
jgi:hypothetical protein